MDSRTSKNIFGFDKRLHYSHVIFSDGQMISGGMREGYSRSTPELRAVRILQFSQNSELLEGWADRYGNYFYSVIVFDTIKLFIFILDEGCTLFVSVA